MAKKKRNPKLLPTLSKRYNDDELISAIRECNGVRTILCQKLDCTQGQLEFTLKSKPELKAVMEEARQGLVDLAEERLVRLLKSEDERVAMSAVKMTLESLGRSRGWGREGYAAMEIKVDKGGVDIRQIFGLPTETQNEQD